MPDASINKKIITGTKWSFLAEISAKIMSPITSMILARLLIPEMFGVVTTVVMIISFADMITDAGFQKLLVQREFFSDKDKYKSTSVAFWTNIFLSFTLWVLIAIFSNQLAMIVGNPGLGHVLSIACISLPMTSFSSIQIALFKRDFDFKSLFLVRLTGVFIPLFITIPLALIFKNYWALIIGTISTNLSNAIVSSLRSNWKPNLFYDFNILKDMISFSSWSLLEEVTIWITLYAGIFVVGNYLNLYYLGLYKTAMGIVNQIMAIIAEATTPVVFSALSRLQNDRKMFVEIFLKFQRGVAIFVIPLGIGIFMYRDIITKIILGNQWTEVSGFIGLWALMSSLTIVFSYFSSEVYRALGKPKLSVLSQLLHLIVLIPVLITTAQINFTTLYVARSLIRFQSIIVDLILIWVVIKISPLKMMVNIFPSIFTSCLMGFLAFGLRAISHNIVWNLVSILICIVFYFLFILLFKNTRNEFMCVIRPFLERISDRKLFKKGVTLIRMEQKNKP